MCRPQISVQPGGAWIGGTEAGFAVVGQILFVSCRVPWEEKTHPNEWSVFQSDFFFLSRGLRGYFKARRLVYAGTPELVPSL